ncbi:MAG: hypothetical protein R3B09_01090 [Nannocystaceae bacterium]
MPDAWDNLIMGLGEKAVGGPRVVVTTTPRTQRHLAKLLDRFKAGDPAVRVIFGSTYDNAANLADEALREFREKYAGTRLERQELHGEMLLDNPHSLRPDAGLFLRIEVAEVREDQSRGASTEVAGTCCPLGIHRAVGERLVIVYGAVSARRRCGQASDCFTADPHLR